MTALMLATSVVLGALCYFEPCTIATHTLFTVRAHDQGPTGRWQSLLAVWITRSALMAGLLALLVEVTEPPAWGPYAPSAILSAMATIYLVSRFAYIPVPHLAFHRLIPRGDRLPQTVQLGLTLPACTLPLFVILAGMAVTADSVVLAVSAGLLFAGFFTLPMVLAAFRGIHAEGRSLLDRAAKSSPFLTAALLYGFALYLLIPAVGLDIDTLSGSLQHASLLGIGLGFLAGFVFSFNPVAFASIPVALAYVTKAHEERRALLLGGAFIAGLLLTHVVLGVAAAAGGEWVKSVMGRHWGLVLGPLLIVMGLLWPGWLRLRLPWIGMRGSRVAGPWGAFLLGIPFSVAVCPFCTPALMVALTAAAAIGSVPFGFALLLAFALGRAVPIALGAWGMGWLESLKVLSRRQKAIETVAGVILILTGLYLLNEYFFLVQY
ncbi:MAG: cytochrome c biogenesis CcdA family protein [Pseudomonadota bacterium]